MEETRKKQIAAEAVSAFETAENCGYVTRHSAASEVTDNASEILQWMPELRVEDLTEAEFDHAVETMLNELY